MKVAYFIGALNRGGAETLVLDVCKRHETVPYDFVCVYRHEGNMSDAFKASGASLIQIPKLKGYLRYLWHIRCVLQQEHVTIVHSQTPSNTLLLAFALVGTGLRIITTFHGHLFADDSWWKRKLVYRASEKIICVSEFQKHYYEEKWKLPKENKLEVVYNGIDFSKIDMLKNERVRELESELIKLAMVGNFIKGRSQMVVARALAKVESGKWREKCDFYFIGRKDDIEPERYEECVRYCEENGLMNVHFLGARNDVPAILKSIEGFVYSTEHDTFGIAVVEAVAAGLPVVVNDWAVMTEVCNLGLPETNCAIRFFKTNDVEDCADKIKELLSDIETNRPKFLDDCRQASMVVKMRYSIQTHIKRLNEIYSSMSE